MTHFNLRIIGIAAGRSIIGEAGPSSLMFTPSGTAFRMGSTSCGSQWVSHC